MKGAEEQDGAARLDLETICGRITVGYADDPERERLDHAIDDAALLVGEVERLRAVVRDLDSRVLNCERAMQAEIAPDFSWGA